MHNYIIIERIRETKKCEICLAICGKISNAVECMKKMFDFAFLCRYHIIGVIIIGGYTAIADAGNTILRLLKDNMTPEPIPNAELIGLCSPADRGDLRLTIYLYSIRENGESRNTGVSGPQALSLSLYYLLTAYSTGDLKSRAFDEYCILGRAMQIINGNSIMKNSVLQGTLAENNEEIRITLNHLTPDEMSKIWSFSNLPLKPSVSYMVWPVKIDSTGFSDVNRVMK